MFNRKLLVTRTCPISSSMWHSAKQLVVPEHLHARGLAPHEQITRIAWEISNRSVGVDFTNQLIAAGLNKPGCCGWLWVSLSKWRGSMLAISWEIVVIEFNHNSPNDVWLLSLITCACTTCLRRIVELLQIWNKCICVHVSTVIVTYHEPTLLAINTLPKIMKRHHSPLIVNR